MDDDHNMLAFPLCRTDAINPAYLTTLETLLYAKHLNKLVLDQHWPQFQQVETIILASLIHVILLKDRKYVANGLVFVEV